MDELRLQNLKGIGCGLIYFLSQELRILNIKHTDHESVSQKIALEQLEDILHEPISELLQILTTALFTLNYHEKSRDLMLDFLFYLIGGLDPKHNKHLQAKLQILYKTMTHSIATACEQKLSKLEEREDRHKFEAVFDCKFGELAGCCRFGGFGVQRLLGFRKHLLDLLDVYVDKLDVL